MQTATLRVLLADVSDHLNLEQKAFEELLAALEIAVTERRNMVEALARLARYISESEVN